MLEVGPCQFANTMFWTSPIVTDKADESNKGLPLWAWVKSISLGISFTFKGLTLFIISNLKSILKAKNVGENVV